MDHRDNSQQTTETSKGNAPELVAQAVQETLTYMACRTLAEDQNQLTNDPLERITKEIRRRTRVIGAFPDGSPVSILAAPRTIAFAFFRRRRGSP